MDWYLDFPLYVYYFSMLLSNMYLNVVKNADGMWYKTLNLTLCTVKSEQRNPGIERIIKLTENNQ